MKSLFLRITSSLLPLFLFLFLFYDVLFYCP